jgi:hypothetical protein
MRTVPANSVQTELPLDSRESQVCRKRLRALPCGYLAQGTGLEHLTATDIGFEALPPFRTVA